VALCLFRGTSRLDVMSAAIVASVAKISGYTAGDAEASMGTDNLSGQPIIISNDMTFNFAN